MQSLHVIQRDCRIVFDDLMVHLCNRGRENLREMKISDFQISTDSAGCRYVSISDKLTKNHQGQNTDDHSQQSRMYELPGKPKCPVMSFEKYIAKLNGELDHFWQKPATRSVTEETICWYEKAPLGVHTLGSKMKTLSVDAGLSTIDTSHCLRATCITALDQAGFEARHIMTMSGQTSEASIRSYSRNVSDNKRRDMSFTLSTHMSATNVLEETTSDTNVTTVSELQSLDSLDCLDIAEMLYCTTPIFNLSHCNVTINNNRLQSFLRLSYHFIIHRCSVLVTVLYDRFLAIIGLLFVL